MADQVETTASEGQEALTGKPYRLGRGRDAAWGGLIPQGGRQPQAGDAVTIVTAKGRRLYKTVDSVVSSGSQGYVVRVSDAGRGDAPAQPAPAGDSAPSAGARAGSGGGFRNLNPSQLARRAERLPGPLPDFADASNVAPLKGITSSYPALTQEEQRIWNEAAQQVLREHPGVSKETASQLTETYVNDKLNPPEKDDYKEVASLERWWGLRVHSSVHVLHILSIRRQVLENRIRLGEADAGQQAEAADLLKAQTAALEQLQGNPQRTATGRISKPWQEDVDRLTEGIALTKMRLDDMSAKPEHVAELRSELAELDRMEEAEKKVQAWRESKHQQAKQDLDAEQKRRGEPPPHVWGIRADPFTTARNRQEQPGVADAPQGETPMPEEDPRPETGPEGQGEPVETAAERMERRVLEIALADTALRNAIAHGSNVDVEANAALERATGQMYRELLGMDRRDTAETDLEALRESAEALEALKGSERVKRIITAPGAETSAPGQPETGEAEDASGPGGESDDGPDSDDDPDSGGESDDRPEEDMFAGMTLPQSPVAEEREGQEGQEEGEDSGVAEALQGPDMGILPQSQVDDESTLKQMAAEHQETEDAAIAAPGHRADPSLQELAEEMGKADAGSDGNDPTLEELAAEAEQSDTDPTLEDLAAQGEQDPQDFQPQAVEQPLPQPTLEGLAEGVQLTPEGESGLPEQPAVRVRRRPVPPGTDVLPASRPAASMGRREIPPGTDVKVLIEEPRPRKDAAGEFRVKRPKLPKTTTRPKAKRETGTRNRGYTPAEVLRFVRQAKRSARR